MTRKKGNILFSIVISIVLFMMTYLFGIIVEFSYGWISNEFLFVIFSGAFASSLVVLISEIFSYKQLKRTVENELFTQTINLFETFYVTNNLLKSILDNSSYQLSDNMLAIPKSQMLAALNCINMIDYALFYKKQELSTTLQLFKSKYNDYNKKINDCTSLDIAICESKIRQLKINPYNNQPINSTYPLVAKTIQILVKNFDLLIIDCDNLLNKIDYSGRFRWQENKERIIQNSQINIESKALEKFFEENKYNM